jgi:hypothetical protein
MGGFLAKTVERQARQLAFVAAFGATMPTTAREPSSRLVTYIGRRAPFNVSVRQRVAEQNGRSLPLVEPGSGTGGSGRLIPLGIGERLSP